MRTRTILVAAAMSLALFLGAATLGYSWLNPAWLDANAAAPTGAENDYPQTFAGILLRNGGACLLVYTGAVTGGITTLAALLGIGAYVGATVHLGIAAVGGGTLFSQVGAYAGIEFLAIVIAGAAALVPIVNVVERAVTTPSDTSSVGSGVLRHYAAAFPASLRLLALALATVTTAAAIEALLIVSR